MANESLGYWPCDTPICNRHLAEVRKDKNGYVYVLCDRCTSQKFIRSKHGSASILGAMKPIAASVAAIGNPPPPRLPEPPLVATTATPTPAPKAADETQPVVTRRRFSSL